MNIDGEEDDLNGAHVLDVSEDQGEQQDGEVQDEQVDAPEPEHEFYGFGDQVTPGDDDEPQHIRDLRQRYRESQKRLAELEAEKAPKAIDPGPKPTLDDEDVNWDQDAFDRKYETWNRRKQEADEQGRSVKEREDSAKREYQGEVDALSDQARQLNVPNFDSLRDRVFLSLSADQQALLTVAADRKAALVAALGANPDKLAELAKVTNPVKFVAAAVRLETQMKQGKRPATQPERKVGGGGVGITPQKADARLAALEAEARKTGDRTKLVAYRRTAGIKV